MRTSMVKIAACTGMLLCSLFASGFTNTSYNQKHIELSLRMIGHEVLLHAGDSSSRILPIERRGGSYWLGFENEFVLNPDRLLLIIDSIGRSSELQGGYVLEVLDCENGSVVYGFEKKDFREASAISCLGRNYAKGCYEFLFTLVYSGDLTGPSEQSTPPSNEDSSINSWVLLLLIMVPLGLFSGIYWARKRRPATSGDGQIVLIGKYQFHLLRTELSLGEERTELTAKEADLLILLFNAVNTTLEREFILKSVWGDDGDYIGRTLDVFISRLRKKLEADPSIKIVNIRGVGYKMILEAALH